jgi:catechol 2,3-dioxygenase-like lactoylglutathione lyase family enzyme
MTDLDSTAPFSTGIDLDHTSFAVCDVLGLARRLRQNVGATPIIGEVLPEFRYLMLYIGTPENGARLELMDPTGPGFLARYLEKHGEGPHHLTFTVPDLRAAVRRARDLGAKVVGESYDHPPWREAFLVPDNTHAVVVQLAQSSRAYPSPAEVLATRTRDTATIPLTRDGTDPLWWSPLWDTSPSGLARLGTTHLGSTDLEFSRRLFEGVLGGRTRPGDDDIEFRWPSGSVRVHTARRAGVRGMSLHGDGGYGTWIGSAWIGDHIGTADRRSQP